MLRHLVFATTGQIPVAAALFATALMVGAGLDTAHPPALAQASIQFEEGDKIERFVKEDVQPGGSVGAPVEASGGTGTLTYSLSGTDAASFTINTGTGQILLAQGASFDHESEKTTYRLAVTATGQPGETASVDVVICVENVNEPPEFDTDNIFFESFEVKENTGANTNIGDPITAVDPEDGEVTYSLAGTDAALFDVDDSGGQVKTKGSLNYEAASSYTVAFTASDSQSNSASIDLTIMVKDVDTEAPGKPAMPAVGPNPVNGHKTLAVTWTVPDNEGPAITSYVVQYRGEDSADEWDHVTVGGSGLETTVSELESGTKYEVQVRAVNDEGEGPWSESGKAETMVAPLANSLPEFDADAVTTLSIPENTLAETAVGAPITASDSDSQDVLTYSLSGTDSALFSLVVSSGQISIGAGTSLDFESPSDSGGNNVYNLTVQVTDGKSADGNADTSVDDTIDVTITVTDVNESPRFGSPNIELEIDENTLTDTNIGDPIAASDPESAVLIYSLSGTDSALFSVGASTGQVRVGASTVLDHESPADSGNDNVYELTVQVTDGKNVDGSSDTSIDDSIIVTITVRNVNEAPEFDSSGVELEVAENTATNSNIGDPIAAVDPEDGDVTYSLTGANAGLFDVDASSGQVKTKGSLNYEAASTYTVAFNASDPQSNSASIALTITVTDIDTEAPGKPAKPSIEPNPGNGHEALKVAWTAPENSGPAITGYIVQFRIDGSGADWTQVTVAANITETAISGLESNTAYEAQVRADNDEGEGAWSESGTADTFAAPVENSPPEFDDGATITLSVGENALPGSAVGAPITASDSDSGDMLVYSLSGADAALFSVGASTGQITVGAGTALDHESPSDGGGDNVYELTLQVTDGRDADGSVDSTVDDLINLTITVTDVNEPPEFGSSAIELEIDENTATNTNIGDPILASDPESDGLTYSLAGVDAASFNVGPLTGQIKAKGLLDHESPSDVGGDNVYELTVQVTDGRDADGNADTAVDHTIALIITVTDVNEPPQFDTSATELEVDENTATNTNIGSLIPALDPESDELTYSLVGVDAASFDIGPLTGQIKTEGLLDHESPSDSGGDNVYNLAVQVTDGRDADGNADTAVDDTVSVAITVTDVNEPPEFGSSAVELEIDENTATNTNIGSLIPALDPESDELTYSLVGVDAASFDIGPLTGQIKTEGLLDHESPSDSGGDNVYNLAVQVTDGRDADGNADTAVDDTVSVAITVTDVNEPPEFGSSAVELEIDENTATNTNIGSLIPALDPESDELTYSLVGVDAASFDIGPLTGQIKTEGLLDHESPSDSGGDNVYNLAVQVTDGRDADGNADTAVDDTVSVAITVTDVNEPPEFGSSAVELEIDENTATNTNIGDSIAASDPESDGITYSLAGVDAASFDVGPLTGQIKTEGLLDHESPSDVGGDNVYELTVQVTDGRDADGNADASVDDTVALTITVTDVNEPPEFGSSAIEMEIDENTATNTNIGDSIAASDPESDGLTYSLAGVDAGSFDVGPLTGQIKTEGLLDHESPSDVGGDNVYELTLEVTDGRDADGSVDSTVDDLINLTITVTDVNEPPEFGSSAIELEIDENTATNTNIGDPIAASDPESDALTYSLVGADSHWFDVDTSSGQIKTKALLDHEAPVDSDFDNIYEFRVWVTDGKDAEGMANPSVDDSIDVTITVVDVNEPPQFDTSAIELEVDENTSANTDIGSLISALDPESDELTYSLVGSDSHWFDIDTSSGQIKTKAQLDHESPLDSDFDNIYEFRVWVTDGKDAEGMANPSVDGSIDVTITVIDVNEPPQFDTSAIELEVDENTSANTNIGSLIPALDPESDELTYSLVGADSHWFDVDTSSGQIRTKALLDRESPVDTGGDNVYEVTVQVTDGTDEVGNADTAVDDTVSVTITVANVNEPPGFDSSVLDLMVVENTAGSTNIGDPIAATDPESDMLTYSLSGVDSDQYDIEPSTGQISVGGTTTFDIESPSDSNLDNVYELAVMVTDGRNPEGNPDDSVDAEIGVKITVTDVNEPPEFDSAALELEVAENYEAGTNVGDPFLATDPESATLTYSLSGADSNLFGIESSSGQISVGAETALDYESPSDSGGDSVYELVVQVTDNTDSDGNPDDSVDAEIGVTITVTDVNEPPEFDAAALELEVAENYEAGANVGDPILATDPESATLAYSLSGADSDLFAIAPLSGQISVGQETALDFESPADSDGDHVYKIVVQVTDNTDLDGNVDDSVDAEIGVIITVTDVNEPPEFELPAVLIEVGENTEANTEVGDPVTAIDPESTELAYSLSGADSGLFSLDVSSGQISVGAETALDFESPSDSDDDNIYELVVQVADGLDEGGNPDDSIDAEIDVTVLVTDIDEPPEFEDLYVWFEVEENTAALTNVGDPILAADPEMAELTYSLVGADAALFDFDPSTGLISIGAATELDHETPADSNGDNVYELAVEVTDGKDENGEPDISVDDEIGVIITVTNVAEPGEVISLTIQLEIEENASANSIVGAPIQAVAPELIELTYSLDGVDADSFDIDPSDGQITTRVQLDYESPVDANGDNVYEVTAKVTDGKDPEGNVDTSVDDEIGVTIRVINVNEAPAAAAVIPDRILVESDGADQFDVSAYFSDPDGDDLSYAATSTDSDVAGVRLVGATLAVTPIGVGTATVEVTAADPGGMSIDQDFLVQVVAAPGSSGGFFPIIPTAPQEVIGSSNSGLDRANLLSENAAIVVPYTLSPMPGQGVVLRAIAFNLLGDPLPASATGVACTWSSDGGGTFAPNGTEFACTTTFTAPPEGSGTITVRVTQGRIAAAGVADFEVTAQETTTAGLEREVIPELEFSVDVTGTILWRGDGASITSPNGLTLKIPAGAIDAEYLGVYIEEMPPSDIVAPESSEFIVGSHAGDFAFTDNAGDPMPGFHTNAPVRICLPITQEDLDTAIGGIDGVHVVHVIPDGEFFHHPPDNDLAEMTTCANVEHFSIYFVGLAAAPLKQTPTPPPTASPTPAPTPTPSPMPTPTPTPTPAPSPMPVPTPEATPILPTTGGAIPGPGALLLTTMAAAAAVVTGLTLFRRFRPVRPCRSR